MIDHVHRYGVYNESMEKEINTQKLSELTIGKLADLVGVNLETIRFYHREGILKEPPKRSNGYRYYNEDHILRLTFIKRAKELGFTLKEIKDLFEMNTKTRATCSFVKKKAEDKISEIDQKIDDLKRIKNSLKELAKACDTGSEEMKQYRVMDCFDTGCEC